MQLNDFIYRYAQYCRVNVNAALLIENWFNKNYDEKYCDYLQEYIRLKPLFLGGKNISANADNAVSIMQRSRVREVYDNLYKLMIDGLKEHKNISQAKERAFRERLEREAPLADDVNFNYISELRKIEEEEY